MKEDSDVAENRRFGGIAVQGSAFDDPPIGGRGDAGGERAPGTGR
jgi:hypothetical protein